MGTAIVATAGAGLPGDVPGLRTACAAVWAFSLTLLVALLGALAPHWILLWPAPAVALAVRARRLGTGFAMTWWAFTFPAGTCVTGAEALARHTGPAVFDALAVVLYVALVAARGVAAVRT